MVAVETESRVVKCVVSYCGEKSSNIALEPSVVFSVTINKQVWIHKAKLSID